MVDNAVYVNGHRTDNPRNLDETYEVMRERGGMAWIGLYRPEPAEIQSVAAGAHARDGHCPLLDLQIP